MNKQEAIHAMQEGKKVTHRYFTDDDEIRNDCARRWSYLSYGRILAMEN